MLDFAPGMYPLGSSVSEYGGRSSDYIDPWSVITKTTSDGKKKQKTAYHWGKEDMAETMGLLFLNPEILKKDFPKRYSHFAPHFPGMAAGPGKYDRETLTGAGSLFFSWQCNGNFVVNAEHYPFTLYTFGTKANWTYFPKVDDMFFDLTDTPPTVDENVIFGLSEPPADNSDRGDFLFWEESVYQKHLPGPADCKF